MTATSPSRPLPPSAYTGEELCLRCGVGLETGNHYALCTDGYPHEESCATYSWRHERLCDGCEAATKNRVSPDCREAKHRACSGDAWDDIEDRPAACECPCHQPEGEAMSGAAPRPYVSRDTELADEIGLPWIAEVPFIDPSGAHLGWSSESFATHAEAFAYAVRNAPKEPEARSFAEEA